MRMSCVAALVLAVVVTIATAPAGAQPIVWDDFKAKTLDPAKWFVGDQLTNGGARGLELRREIAGGKLVMSHRAVGSDDTALVRGFSGNRLFMFPPSPFTSLQADVRVTTLATTDCTADNEFSVASLTQFNRLFNTNALAADTGGQCTTPSCDVYAIVIIEHSNPFNGDPNVMDLRARVEARPLDNSPAITINDVHLGAALRKNVTTTFKWVWNAANHTVTFSTTQRNTAPVVIDYGAVASTNPMPFLYNSVEVDQFPCNSTTAPGTTELGATVDNIKVTD